MTFSSCSVPQVTRQQHHMQYLHLHLPECLYMVRTEKQTAFGKDIRVLSQVSPNVLCELHKQTPNIWLPLKHFDKSITKKPTHKQPNTPKTSTFTNFFSETLALILKSLKYFGKK